MQLGNMQNEKVSPQQHARIELRLVSAGLYMVLSQSYSVLYRICQRAQRLVGPVSDRS